MKLSTSIVIILSIFLINLTLAFKCSATFLNLTKLDTTQNLVKAGDKYITLLGQQVEIGDQAPNFTVVDKNFSPVSLKQFKQQTVLISTVPSLDTGICSIQTKRFNDEASKMTKNITVLTISNDLPFAQKRFCKTEKITQNKVLSDSVWRDFGAKYGLLIKDMGLLTRAIFIIDSTGKIAYKELVENISKHPNYEKALIAVRDIASAAYLKKSNNNSPTKTKNISEKDKK